MRFFKKPKLTVQEKQAIRKRAQTIVQKELEEERKKKDKQFKAEMMQKEIEKQRRKAQPLSSKLKLSPNAKKIGRETMSFLSDIGKASRKFNTAMTEKERKR